MQSKNVIFLSLVQIDSLNERGIYQDLLRQFILNGHNVSVVCPVERRKGISTRLIREPNVTILQVKTLNVQKSPLWEKGLATISLNFLMKKAIRKYLLDTKFDLILYATPPITITGLISWLKGRNNAFTYLLLKDIFPQNAVDMGMFTKKSLIHHYFKRKEIMLYSISNRIGCMSPANVNYIANNHPNFQDKLEVNPNSIDLSRIPKCEVNRNSILSKWNIPIDSVIFLYGGNLGKPQGAKFLFELIKDGNSYPNAYFLIIGDGTDYGDLAAWFKENKPRNAKLIKMLPKSEYDNLAACCNVGIILLRKEFTIPNFPSRLLSYLENRMPILAITDNSSDIGIIAESHFFGKWAFYGNVEVARRWVAYFAFNADKVKEMGAKGFEFLKSEYDVKSSYNKIIRVVSESI
jgi:hypothetical protein